MSSSVRRLVAPLVAVVLISAVVAGLWLCHVMKQTPFMAGPERFDICGRTWVGPGYNFDAVQLRGIKAGRLGTVWTWQGKREVWGRRVRVEGDGCGTGVYLNVSDYKFRGYALSRGP